MIQKSQRPDIYNLIYLSWLLSRQNVAKIETQKELTAENQTVSSL